MTATREPIGNAGAMAALSGCPKPRRGIGSVADVRARCQVDPATHCWHWLGAKGKGGVPRLWTFDHAAGEKRSLPAPKAIWNLAHGEAPNGMPFRRCLVCDCVNPAHLRLARDKAEMGRHIARNGKRKGTHLEQRRANAAKAQAASGCLPTPEPIVRAIREWTGTTLAFARANGMWPSTVSSIRRGLSRASA